MQPAMAEYRPHSAPERFALAFGLLLLLELLVSIRVDAQEQSPSRSAIVRVTVVGPENARLAGVNLAIGRRDVGAILSGRTNDSGVYSFHVAIAPGVHTVLARRPGFAPAEVRVDFGNADTVRVVLRLQTASGMQLDPVRVEAPRSNYMLDATQIAASGRPIRDAFEALSKLRPSMLYDKDRCKGEVVDNVWINGRRVLFMAKQVPVLGARSSRMIGGVRVTSSGRSARSEPPAVDSMLASIRAEHVAEIRLVNCWDTSLPGVGAKNALYVSLKPGVDWDWKRGSFAVDSLYRRK